MYTRRTFLRNSAGLLGGLTLVSTTPLLTACGDDDDDDDAGDDAGAEPADTTGSTAAAPTSAATATTMAMATGAVATVFNWLPDIEWSAWYLAESKGYFSDHGVESSLVHGGPNTPAVSQVLAAGDGNVGLSASELDIIRANQEGSDFVVIGAMYQRNPLGLTWLADSGITGVEDLVGKRLGGPQGDQVQMEAMFRANGLEPDFEFIPMGFDPQPLADGEMDAIASYVTNQPLQLQLLGYDAIGVPYSDLGLPSYGDILFASRAWLDENPDLVVGYLTALLMGANDNRADPTESLAILLSDYGADAEINEEYAALANPQYIALMDSPFTDANGLLVIDPERMGGEVLPTLEVAGETDLPTVEEFIDMSYIEAAHASMS